MPGHARHSHAGLRRHEVEVPAERERRGREDRGALTDTGSTDGCGHVKGPNGEARIIGLILRDVGDRLVGVPPPRFERRDQLINGGTG